MLIYQRVSTNHYNEMTTHPPSWHPDARPIPSFSPNLRGLWRKAFERDYKIIRHS